LQNVQINNVAVLSGKISDELIFSHEVYDEKFYSFTLSVPRLSGVADEIIITVSEHLLHGKDFNVGDEIMVNGQFRSYNNYSSAGNKLILTMFAKDITKANTCDDESEPYVNEITLNGFVCKPPIYRTTPFGREISDLLIAVNRTYNKSDYIPCIAWGRNAKFASTLSVGDRVEIKGRIQSREYQKKISEDEVVTKVAYEVSVSKIALVEN
jgi:primosomal replication protein N